MAPKRNNKSYPASFKLIVISKAEEVGNRAAGREFGVDERCVRRWRSEKESLLKMPKTKRSRRSGKPAWPELETNLEKWILSQRDKGLPVSTVKVRLQAKMIAANMGMNEFKAGTNWCFRFMKRKKLSVRARTTVGQKLPDDWEIKRSDFLKFTHEQIKENKFSTDQVINMDEVPLTFDCPPSRTVNKVGESTVGIITTGHEKTSFTCVLSCTASGVKLNPILIFKRKTLPKGDFPKDILIRANEKGWNNESIMQDWLQEVWRKRKGAFFNPKGLLIMDSMRAHLTEPVKASAKSVSAKLAIIPGGLTKLIQPLDLAVNKAFKCRMRTLWESWMIEGQHSYTNRGFMRKATFVEVAKWVSEAWRDVSIKTITNSFVKSGIIVPSDEDCSEENSSSDEEDADDPETGLDPAILSLFNSDTEDEDFDGFD